MATTLGPAPGLALLFSVSLTDPAAHAPGLGGLSKFSAPDVRGTKGINLHVLAAGAHTCLAEAAGQLSQMGETEA